MQKLFSYLQLMRLNKPVGIFLLLWPTLSALWIAADGKPHLKNIIIFILGVITMRSAGCVINDIADRKIDAQVSRTRFRPLVTGDVSLVEAYIIFAVLCTVGLLLVFLLNTLTLLVAFTAVFLIVLYPFTKRFFYLPQLILGAVWSMSVIMAFTAENAPLSFVAWFFYGIVLIWTVMFDTLYAMADRDDDVKINIKSTAILFGDKDKYIIALLQFIIIILLIALGLYLRFKWFYFLCCLLGALLFIYQQYLIKDRNPVQCFKAFLNNQWLGLVIFIAVISNYLKP